MRRLDRNGNPNLVNGRELDYETAAEMGRKGALALAAKRRQAKSMREIARAIAAAPVEDSKIISILQKYGLTEEEMQADSLAVVKVLQKANRGDLLAVKVWQDLKQDLDIKDDSNTRFELPASLMGSLFVDINRDISEGRHLEYVFKGGRGGIKSTYIAEKIVELIKNHNRIHACVLRKVSNTLKDSVFAQLKWAICMLGLEDEFKFTTSPLEIKYIPTGQTIYFRGADDPEKIKSIKPPFGYIGVLWFEELDQFAGDAECRNIQQSVIRGGEEAWIFKSFNPPISIQNWANQYVLIPKDNMLVHQSDYLHVPPEWLGQPFIEEAEWQRDHNPRVYEHEYLGKAVGTGGTVFENLQLEKITSEQIARFDKILIGQDWGWFPDPNATIVCYYDRHNRKLYLFDEIHRIKTGNEEQAQIMKAYQNFTIIADSAEQKTITWFNSQGFHMRGARKPPGSVEYGIKWLAALVQIVVDPERCPHAAKEFSNYEHMRDKEGNFISGYPDENNHFIDATRYALNDYIIGGMDMQRRQ